MTLYQECCEGCYPTLYSHEMEINALRHELANLREIVKNTIELKKQGLL